MATDNEQAPHVPIGKTNADSDSSHLVHSSPEVIFSASSSMTSFPQPTMKPSKFGGKNFNNYFVD